MQITLEELRDAAEQAIVNYLDARELQYARTDDGVFVTSFVARREPVPVLMRAGADAGPGIAVSVSSPRAIPRDRWGWTLFAINTWNAKLLAVKARLAIPDVDTSETGRVVVEGWMPYVGAVADDSVFAFLDLAIRGALVCLGEAGEVSD
jgi:hypothetical protein